MWTISIECQEDTRPMVHSQKHSRKENHIRDRHKESDVSRFEISDGEFVFHGLLCDGGCGCLRHDGRLFLA